MLESIPKVVMVNDGKASYFIPIIVEDNIVEDEWKRTKLVKSLSYERQFSYQRRGAEVVSGFRKQKTRKGKEGRLFKF